MTRVSNQNQYNIVVVNGALWLRDKIRNEKCCLYMLTPEEVARFTVNPPRLVIDESLIGQELQTRRLSFTWQSRPCQTLPPVYDRNYDAPASQSLMACEQDYGAGIVHASEVRGLRQAMYDIVRARNDSVFTRMPDEVRWQLATNLAHAAMRARIGLDGVFEGSRAKPASWTLDNLVFDVCWALWWAGVPITKDRDPSFSHAQMLAREIAALLGLTGDDGTLGSLYPSMKRAAGYLSALSPDDEVASAWLDGRLAAEFEL